MNGYWSEEMNEERSDRTANAWEKIADAFFEGHGWTKDHMAYDTDRGTGSLWVMTHPEVWEDTGISAKKADRLLTDGWDTAEIIGYEAWMEEQGDDE